MRKLILLISFLLLAVPGFSQRLLRQSTATTFNIGPFQDSTGAATNPTVTNITIVWIKQSDTGSASSDTWTPTASGGSHDCVAITNDTSVKNCELTTGDTDTVGRINWTAAVSGSLKSFGWFQVVPAATYDTIVTNGPASGADLLNTATASLTTVGGLGKLIVDNLDQSISSVLTILGTPAATDVSTDIANVQAVLPAALVGGRMDASVGAYQTGQVPLQPTVAGRTLGVSSTGYPGIDWGDIANPTTVVDLSNTNVKTVGSVTGAVGSVTGAVGSVTGAVGSVTGNVGGNVTGSVGSVAASGISSSSFAAGAINAAAIATDAIGAAELAGDAVTEIQSGLSTLNATGVENAVWNATQASHVGAGTTGASMNAASSAGDPWATSLPAAYGSGTAGKIIGELDGRIPAALVGGRIDANVGAYSVGSEPLKPTTAGRTLDVTATGAAGIDWANVENPTTTLNLSGTSTKAVEPTVAGRTLDVSAGGEAGVDWANVGSPTTAVNLSGTTISTSQAVASVSGAVGSVTGAVGSVTGNVGGNITGNVGGSVGSVTGGVGGNVTGSVGSVAAGGITAASFGAGAINAAAIAADAILKMGMVTGTATAGGATSITLAAGDAGTSKSYIYGVITLTGGTGQGQQAIITDYNSATKVATIFCQATATGAWTTNPGNGTTYSIIPGRR